MNLIIVTNNPNTYTHTRNTHAMNMADAAKALVNPFETNTLTLLVSLGERLGSISEYANYTTLPTNDSNERTTELRASCTGGLSGNVLFAVWPLGECKVQNNG